MASDLTLIHVIKSYPSPGSGGTGGAGGSREILRDISLHVDRGSFVTIPGGTSPLPTRVCPPPQGVPLLTDLGISY